MANIKITDLTAYTDPDSTDVLPIVDVGADVTKKVSIAYLLGNGTQRVNFGNGEVVFNETGENYDFRIEGDTEPNLVFVDASTNRVGLETSTPDFTLDVNGTVGIAEGQAVSWHDGSGTLAARIYASATDELRFERGSGASRSMTIDSSGRLLVGTSSSVSSAPNAAVEVIGAGTQGGELALGRNDTSIQEANSIGIISFWGNDSDGLYDECASITAFADGTHGNDSKPTRLEFSVTADDASSPTEAMRIKNTRVINFSNAPVYADNAAAKTGGLVDGDVYRTSTGDLKIVYT